MVCSRNRGRLDLVRRARHTGGEVVERILLAVEFAEAEGKEDAAGERETGHERVVDDEVRVLGEREERKAETANVRKSAKGDQHDPRAKGADVRRGDGRHEELDRHDHRAHRLGCL